MLPNREPIILSGFTQAQLWEYVKEGSRNAFKEIYQRNLPELYRYGYALCKDKELTMDAIQDLFVDLWKYQRNLSSTKEVKFYLLKSMKNKLSAILKDKKRRESLLTTAEVRAIFADDRELNYTNESLTLTNNRLRISINDLPVKQREALMLIYFESKSYQEVSLIMNTKLETVRALVRRGIKSMRRKMKRVTSA